MRFLSEAFSSARQRFNRTGRKPKVLAAIVLSLAVLLPVTTVTANAAQQSANPAISWPVGLASDQCGDWASQVHYWAQMRVTKYKDGRRRVYVTWTRRDSARNESIRIKSVKINGRARAASPGVFRGDSTRASHRATFQWVHTGAGGSTTPTCSVSASV